MLNPEPKFRILMKPGADPEQFEQERKQLQEQLKGVAQNIKNEIRQQTIEDFWKATEFPPESLEFINAEISLLEHCSQAKRKLIVESLIITIVTNILAPFMGKATASEVMQMISPDFEKQSWDIAGKDPMTGKLVLTKKVKAGE